MKIFVVSLVLFVAVQMARGGSVFRLPQWLSFSPPEIQEMVFDPEDGMRYRQEFQDKHGHRGQHLVEQFGQGLPGEQDENLTVLATATEVSSVQLNTVLTSTTELTTNTATTSATTADSETTTGTNYYTLASESLLFTNSL